MAYLKIDTTSLKRAPRMIISTEGKESSGKTRFALEGTPRPLLYLDTDFGYEGTADESMWEGVNRAEVDLTLPPGASPDDPQAVRIAKDLMDRYVETFRSAINRDRMIVADTFTTAWAGQRLARKNDPYVMYEEEFKALVRACYKSETTNLILIHHMARDWKRNKEGNAYKGDTWSRDGMDGILTQVQLAIQQSYQPPTADPTKVPGFYMDILKARDNKPLEGQRVSSMTWVDLCTLACPSVNWGE